MKVPRPIMIAAKIIMLRMTLLALARFADFITRATNPRPVANREGGNFGEKDERRVNRAIPSYAGLTRVSIDLRKSFFHGDGLPCHRRAEATPFFERSSPAMTTYVPLGLTRRVGIALAGSSGQG